MAVVFGAEVVVVEEGEGDALCWVAGGELLVLVSLGWRLRLARRLASLDSGGSRPSRRRDLMIRSRRLASLVAGSVWAARDALLPWARRWMDSLER